MEGTSKASGYGVCLRCGKLMPAEASFCNSCGAYLNADPVVGLQGSVAPALFRSLRMGGPVPGAQFTAEPSVEPPAATAVTGTPAAAMPSPGQGDVQRPPSRAAPMADHGLRAGHTRPKTDIMAVISLVCAIASFLVPLIPAVAAIALGSTSQERIRESGGELKGGNLAILGTALGIANIVIVVIVVLLVLMTAL